MSAQRCLDGVLNDPECCCCACSTPSDNVAIAALAAGTICAMNGDTSFWLGLALAIPIGIGVNLATPYLQTALARRSSRWRHEAAQRQERDQALASWLVSDQKAILLRANVAIMDALEYAFTSMALFVAALVFIGIVRFSTVTFAALALLSATAGLVQFIKLLNHIRRVRRIANEINAAMGWPRLGQDPRAGAGSKTSPDLTATVTATDPDDNDHA